MVMNHAGWIKKVPEVTGLFWVIKILSTALGEATSDFLVFSISPVVAVCLGFVGLVIALAIQFFAKKYTPWKYWLTVSMVAIFGTMVADVIHVGFGVPYVVSTVGFAIILAAVFMLWHQKEKTLSIHSITTPRKEVFYWLTVMATFALGTAAGDMTASTLQLGYLDSGILFAALIAVPLVVYAVTKRHEVLWFWTAYVLTRPLGASFADWFGKAPSVSGLGLGDGVVVAVLMVAIVGAVVYATVNTRERRAEG